MLRIRAEFLLGSAAIYFTIYLYDVLSFCPLFLVLDRWRRRLLVSGAPLEEVVFGLRGLYVATRRSLRLAG
ncbi:MAG: hypothetical protein AVDCRST_MAG93-3916 [uncultured Chloroflexia bacterium]|uniref:Uncharacterized protein n=1 Tax=uncultured Chloroflexia bacterium TaxID=1672391 RepID=A0A6J4JYW7_9CHLR|nr:MAG: hypothetical protein AVDCRST_MAG93-3916 [uncultured Chloroflexia bacterium]